MKDVHLKIVPHPLVAKFVRLPTQQIRVRLRLARRHLFMLDVLVVEKNAFMKGQKCEASQMPLV